MATAKLSEWTPENTNFARLCKLLIHGGTHVLKDIFDFIHPPHLLQSHLSDRRNHAVLQRLKARKILFQEQWDKLYPSGGSTVTSTSFDITLLCLLLRNICNLSLPTAGDWNATPAPTSTNKEDDIVRVQQFRNHLYGHITEPSLSDTDFNQYWDDIASVLVRLGGSQAEIDQLKRVCINPEDEEYYIKVLEDWNSSEKRLWKYLEAMTQKVDETQQKLQDMDETLKKVASILQCSTRESQFQDPLMYSQNLKLAMKDQLENYQEWIDDIFTNLVIKQRQTKHSNSSYCRIYYVNVDADADYRADDDYYDYADCFDDMAGDDCYDYAGDDCYDYAAGDDCYDDMAGDDCYDYAGDDCYDYAAGDDCYDEYGW